MSDIKPTAKAWMDEVRKEHPSVSAYTLAVFALQRAIEQHEAFKQKVSNTVWHYIHVDGGPDYWGELEALIIPAPKPDPLVAALEGVTFDHYPLNDAKTIRAVLDALGFEIREKNDG